ncbi:hypothetical protein GCM10011608_28400 [Micromonospora sonchi]|uniref:Translation initiation factor IF-3 n=1 Tax=Micromonospora sonchi TaxID=1763543 RepID=A0A917TX97_9ACTN|nr:hypothetical protein GCM10011608_28400 [Micromonospora sonchi]
MAVKVERPAPTRVAAFGGRVRSPVPGTSRFRMHDPVIVPTGRAGPGMCRGLLLSGPVPNRGPPGRLTDEEPTRGGPISVEPRVNEQIRAREVRLVGPEGEQVGIVPLERALQLAADVDLDLVEVAPMARPPVCKLMDFGKFKYESALKAREARRNQQQTVIKEMKLRPKIDPHDYETKKGHVVRFLKAGDKVKVTIMFRGREQSRPELGYRLLRRLESEITELGYVESAPKQDGRNMIMVLAPHRAVKASAVAATASRGGPRERTAEEPADAVAAESTATSESAAAGETGMTADTNGQ